VGESDSPTIFCGLTGLRGRKKGPFTERKDFDECADGSENVSRGQALGAAGRRSSGRFDAHQRGRGAAAGLVGRGDGAFFEILQNPASRNRAEVGDGGLRALLGLRRRAKGEGRRAKGEGRRAKGEGRRAESGTESSSERSVQGDLPGPGGAVEQWLEKSSQTVKVRWRHRDAQPAGWAVRLLVCRSWCFFTTDGSCHLPGNRAAASPKPGAAGRMDRPPN
jgi:hypothetical protein